jgi:hypothetical protein
VVTDPTSVIFFVMSNMVKEWCAKSGLATATTVSNMQDRNAWEVVIGRPSSILFDCRSQYKGTRVPVSTGSAATPDQP